MTKATKKTYEIESKASGLVLGRYDGETEQDALDAMARDAGYADHEDACSQSQDDGNHLIVTEVEAGS